MGFWNVLIIKQHLQRITQNTFLNLNKFIQVKAYKINPSLIHSFSGQYLSISPCIYTSGGLGNEAVMVTPAASLQNVLQLESIQEGDTLNMILHAPTLKISIVVFILMEIGLCYLCIAKNK